MGQNLTIHKDGKQRASALWWRPVFLFQKGMNDALCEAASDFFPPAFVEAQSKAFSLWQDNLHRLFSETFNSRQMVMPWIAGKRPRPHINIEENAKGYVVRAGVSGSCPKDIDVSIADSALTISGCPGSGCKKGEGAYIHHESCDDSFSRTVALPADADTSAATATFDNGLLIVDIPKMSQMPEKARRLRVVSATGGKKPTSPAGEKAA